MFTAKFKSKKHHFQNKGNCPFPVGHQKDGKVVKFVGFFTGLSVEITNKDQIKSLCENGSYGNRLKFKKTRTVDSSSEVQTKKNDENLVLDLEETFFLFYVLKVLKITDLMGEEISIEELLNKIIQIKRNFLYTFVGYIYLKSKNWIVKSGMKFGADFLTYKRSIKHYHASFIVLISDALQIAKDIQGIQRIAETTGKDVLFLEIKTSNDIQNMQPIEQLQHLNSFKISETIVRRLDYKLFVQNSK